MVARSAASGVFVTSTLVENVSAVPGATVTDALDALETKGGGEFNVDSYGAVPLPFAHAHPDPTDPLVTANVVAFAEALAAAHAAGGTVRCSSGVYYTNAAIGFSVTADTNVSVTLQGAGPFPATLIYCLTATEPLLMLHSTVANIRSFYLKDIALVGGRQNLSLELCWYCRFERVFFWGAEQFALQCHNSGLNEFVECFFNELTAGGGLGDAVILLASSASFTACTFGEGGGGILNLGGALQIIGGTIFDSWYKGSPYTDYWTTPGSPTNQPLTGAPWFASKSTLVSSAEICTIIDGVRLGARFQGMFCEFSHRVVVTGGEWFSDSVTPGDGHFVGFIEAFNFVGDTSLTLQGTQFYLNSNGVAGDSGYFIYEPSNLFHDQLISAVVIIPPGATLSPPSVTSPALLNPGTENNSFTLKEFHSTSI